MDKTSVPKSRRSPARKDWSRQAACQGMKNFDTPRTESEEKKNREVCLDCPVLDYCLEYSLAHYKEVGFWAGTTRSQRNQIRQNLPYQALSLAHVESHSSVEFGAALSSQNPPVKRLLPRVDLELYSSLDEEW